MTAHLHDNSDAAGRFEASKAPEAPGGGSEADRLAVLVQTGLTHSEDPRAPSAAAVAAAPRPGRTQRLTVSGHRFRPIDWGGTGDQI